MTRELPPSLASRFPVVRPLGRGGFGSVFLCQDSRSGTRVALKLLEAADQGSIRERFEREARVTARIRHPHIVRVLEHGIAPEGDPWIAYEYIEGESLEELRRRVQEPNPVLVVQWGVEIAEALAVVHREGVFHRDVKPANILIRASLQAVLCDFGIARTEGPGTIRTETGILLGTPPFMAPELWRGSPPSAASDQFALAASLHLVLRGTFPYGCEDPAGILAAIQDRSTRGTSLLPPGPEASLSGVLSRSLSLDPGDRFPSMGDLAAALRRAEPDRGSPEPPRPDLPPPPDSTQQLALLGGPAATRVLATRDVPPRPPPAPRTRAVAFALLLGLGAVLRSLAPSGIQDTAPPGEPSPESRPIDPMGPALALRRALDRISEITQDTLAPREACFDRSHREGRREAYADPELVEAWDAVMAAIRSVAEAKTPPRSSTLAPDVARLHHFLRELRAADAASTSIFDLPDAALGDAAEGEVHRGVRANLGAISDRFASLEGAWPLRTYWENTPVLALLSAISTGLQVPERGPRALAIQTGIEGDPDSPLFDSLLWSRADLLASLVDNTSVTCEVREELAARMSRLLAGPHPFPGPSRRLAMTLEMWAVSRHSWLCAGTRPSGHGPFDATLENLEQEASRWTPEERYRLAVLAHDSLEFFRVRFEVAPPELAPRKLRVEDLTRLSPGIASP